VTIIEVRAYRGRWKVFEIPGVEFFLNQEHAIDHANARCVLSLCRDLRFGFKRRSQSALFRSMRQTESCNAPPDSAIRVTIFSLSSC
jgi:hypothetical protein